MTVPRLFATTCLFVVFFASASFGQDWVPLFNGKDLSGWRPNTQPEAFSVTEGVLRVHATKSYAHLFYVGDGTAEAGRFKNFELEAVVRSELNSNSGIFFHTDIASAEGGRLALKQGYEVQLNSSPKELRKTGSLYAVADVAKSPVDETQWFRIRIRVEGKHVEVRVSDQKVVDYIEPENPARTPGLAGRLISPNGGSIALQAHDPQSTFYFKEVKIRRLP